MHSAAPPGPSGSRRSNTRATRLKSEWTVPRSIEIAISSPAGAREEYRDIRARKVSASGSYSRW
jgi:hypothetical protein